MHNYMDVNDLWAYCDHFVKPHGPVISLLRAITLEYIASIARSQYIESVLSLVLGFFSSHV